MATGKVSTAEVQAKISPKPVGLVDVPLEIYDEMKKKWDMIDDLMGGTKTMRDAGNTYLPQEEAERQTAYANRLQRSILFNGLRDTIKRITTKPFSKPITLAMPKDAKIKSPIDEIAMDVDKTGKNLTELGRELLEDAARYGKGHLLVDYPRTSGELPLAEERGQSLRPLFIRISPLQVIGWRTEKDSAGRTILVQVRIKEIINAPDGEYGSQEVEQVRVYTETTCEIWQRKPKENEKEYVKTEEIPHTFGEVPFFTFYVARTGYLTAEPPLEDLAWVNIAHWQSMSDQRNILKFARVALLFLKGMTVDELEDAGGIIIGANMAFLAQSQDADAKYVEHSGQAIKAGEEDLQRLEERMEILGLQPFLQRSGNQTATGKAIDEGKQQSEIQAWIRALEGLLEQAYRAAAKWVNVQLPDEFSVDIFNDFGIGLRSSEEVEALIKARKNKEISRETFLKELKRRGLLSDSVDVAAEMERVEDEGPELADLGGPFPGDKEAGFEEEGEEE